MRALVLAFAIASPEPPPEPLPPEDPPPSEPRRPTERPGGARRPGRETPTETPPIASRPPPTIFGEEIEDPGMLGDIHPVQVVQQGQHRLDEGVPLVEGKETIVRVYVNLPLGVKEMKDVKCTLRWWGDGGAMQASELTADLVQRGKRTHVIKQSPGRADGFKGEDTTWAYNFMFTDGRPRRGTGGRRAPKRLILQAELTDKNGNALGLLSERSGDTFRIVAGKDIKVAALVLSWDTSTDFGPNDKDLTRAELLAATAEEVRHSLLALYPIAHENLTIDTFDGGRVNTSWKTWSGAMEDVAALYNASATYSAYDYVLVRTTIVPGDWGGYNPIGQDRVGFFWLDPRMTPAHEAGHSSQLLGAGHGESEVQDAWDAGRRFVVSQPNRWGVNNLMRRKPVGAGWISLKEYRRLLPVLTK